MSQPDPSTNGRMSIEKIIAIIDSAPGDGIPMFFNTPLWPELATAFLNRNERNRPLTESRVYRYAADASGARWKRTGETIKFDWNGNILDGQHRLYACIEADCTFPVSIAYNIDPDAFSAVDRGKSRTIADSLALLGHKNATILAAALARLRRYERGVIHSTNSAQAYVNTDEAINALERHPRMEESARIARRTKIRRPKRVGHPAPPSLMAYLHYLFAQKDAGLTGWFFEKLKTGANLPETCGLYHLRNRMIDDKLSNKERMSNKEKDALFRKAWNAHREGKTVKVLRWSPHENWPDIL